MNRPTDKPTWYVMRDPDGFYLGESASGLGLGLRVQAGPFTMDKAEVELCRWINAEEDHDDAWHAENDAAN